MGSLSERLARSVDADDRQEEKQGQSRQDSVDRDEHGDDGGDEGEVDLNTDVSVSPGHTDNRGSH